MNGRGADLDGGGTGGEDDGTLESDQRDGYGVDRDHGRDDRHPEVERPTVDPAIKTESAPSGSDPTAGGGGGGSEPPDSDTIRNWTGLTLALAMASFLSAVVILVADDAPMAVAGAVVLGLGFGAITVAGRTAAPRVFGMLDDAWAEHRLYVWFSTGLFAVGILFGALLYAAGVNLVDLFLEIIMEEFGEDELPGGDDELADEGHLELSATFFITNNTPPFLAAIFGALTLGLVTFVIMVFNGILVGNIAAVTGAEVGFGVIIALLVPHGIFELPALFIAAGVGFRFLHRTGQRIAGSRDALFTKAYLLRTTALVVFAWLILVLAAFVEAYVTFQIADALFEL